MTSSTSMSDRLTWAVLILVLLGAGVAWAWRAVLFVPEPEPAVAVAAPIAFPEFTLTERSGRSVSRTELLGRPWVANFVFTSCGGPCPVMSRRMGELQRAFADCPLRFVSFTLDPQRDTPAVLTEYAKRFDADPDQWLFLTGDEATIQGLARQGLKLTARRATEAELEQGADAIIHSTRFVLIDAAGRLAGSYIGTDDADLGRLRDDLGTLCRSDGP